MGYILLAGGAEFNGLMKICDQAAISLAGGSQARISIIPAAAAPDNNHLRAGKTGVEWFVSIGAENVEYLHLIDPNSANAPDVVDKLERSDLIYMLGGFPGHLKQTLSGSSSWEAMVQAYKQGAVIGGSSAGAMVLCEHMYDPMGQKIVSGLGLLKNRLVIPHHDTYGAKWSDLILKQLPETVLIGIDEQTGTIYDSSQQTWQVYGKGGVSLYRKNTIKTYASGHVFELYL